MDMDPEEIVARIIGREAGFVDHPFDRGGPTKYGITLKTLSEWRGHPCTREDVENLEMAEARRIYLSEYVSKPGFDRISDPDLRELVIDTGVNHGRARATRWLQETANRLGAGLKVDGVVGPKTLAAVNGLPARPLFVRLIVRRLQGFADYVQSDPRQLYALEGWVVRAGEFMLRVI